jgi:hypothetical protein
MSLRPEIFVSAVVPELNAFRKVARQTLLEIGARPLEQTDYSIEYGPLHGVLSQMLNRCEAVIHLAGFDYGMEPAERTLHAPRRSFAQYEVDVARLVGKPMYVFMTTEACQAEPHKWEDEEKRFLQTQHRMALERTGATIIPFSSADELAQHIRKLRPQLIVRHSLARLPARPMGPRFIGRHRLMEELAEKLAPGRIDVLHPIAGGPTSGQGKSCLAIEVGWRLHDERRFDFVFWIPAGPRADLEVSLAALARTDSLALLPDEVVSHRTRFEAVREWLAQEKNSGRWLMIIDGVDDEIAWWSLRTILPDFAKGAVLLTGSRPAWPGSFGHGLTSFSAERARDLLAHRLAKGFPGIAAEKHAWDRLAEGVGRLPLALEIAAAHLLERKQSARDFLTAWAASTKPAVGVVGPTAVEMIEIALRDLDPTALAFLRTLSCLDAQPNAIPVALFEHRGDWPLNSAAIEVLERRGLILRDDAGLTLSLHKFVREIVRDRIPAQDMATALGAARSELDALLQRSPSKSGRDAGVRELLIPHCRALMGQINGHPLELHAGPIARALGDWLKNNGRLTEAETFYRRALAIEERRLGPTHQDIAPRLRDLIALLRTQRRLKRGGGDVTSPHRSARAGAAAGSQHALQRPDSVCGHSQGYQPSRRCRGGGPASVRSWLSRLPVRSIPEWRWLCTISPAPLRLLIACARRSRSTGGPWPSRSASLAVLTRGSPLASITLGLSWRVSAAGTMPTAFSAKGLDLEESKLGSDHCRSRPCAGCDGKSDGGRGATARGGAALPAGPPCAGAGLGGGSPRDRDGSYQPRRGPRGAGEDRGGERPLRARGA